MTPTCEQMFEEDGLISVSRESDDSWRHGCDIYEVFHRTADNTYWSADYQVSTDGETNGLRENEAEITEVVPIQELVTKYVAKRKI